MGVRTPAFEVIAGGADVTRLVRDSLLNLRLAITSDRTSDTLEIELSDADAKLALPAAEREMRVSIGYEDAGLVGMGVYYHDESEIDLEPRRLVVRATAADFRRRSTLKAPKRRAWDNVSLGDLVATIAAEHDYRGAVPPSLSGIVIPHIDQTAESDLHLLRRLSRQYDATFKAVGGSLVFAPRGSGRTALSGQTMPTVRLAPGARRAGERSVLSARYAVKGRPRFGAVVAGYQDVASASFVHVKAGAGEPVYEIREPLPDRAQAEAAAAARLGRFARQTKELDLTVPGDPRLVSEAVLELEDWPEPGIGQWTILRADHNLSKGRGYTTRVTAEPRE